MSSRALKFLESLNKIRKLREETKEEINSADTSDAKSYSEGLPVTEFEKTASDAINGTLHVFNKGRLYSVSSLAIEGKNVVFTIGLSTLTISEAIKQIKKVKDVNSICQIKKLGVVTKIRVEEDKVILGI